MSTNSPGIDRSKGDAAYGSVDELLATASLKNPDICAHPNAYYAAMRVKDPVHFDRKLGVWLVSRYEDLQTVFRDPMTFSMKHGYESTYAKGFIAEFKQILERDGGGFFPDAIMTDPPEHTRVRKLMDKAFTVHRVKQLELGITALVANMIDALADKGQCEFVKDFAQPMTIAIICEQLGLDHFDGHKIERWSQAVVQQISHMQTRERMIENAQQICELQNYLIDRIREREAEPREDMISDLVHAVTEDGTKLTFKETVSLVRAMLIAGNETTATALTNLFFLLATQPEQAELLRAAADDDRLLTRFVEELLRIEGPVRALSRMTTREVELGGTKLPANAPLLVLFASGNDDEKEFACPRHFDINRSNLVRHVGFGAGPHRCIGSALARMELKVAARELIKRLDNFKLEIPLDQVAFMPTVSTRTIAALPVSFTRRQ
jgi:cytochrome P450